MGDLSKQIIDDWGQGVNTSMEPDLVPDGAYIHGLNLALTSIGGGKAVIMKRKGMSVMNATQVTGASAVIGLHDFRRLDSGTFTPHRLIVSDNGRLDQFNDSGALTTISASAFTSSTSQEHIPDFADAQNSCYIVNGAETRRYDGTTLFGFGITEPGGAPSLAAGAAGSHTGTYEGRVTFYNSVTLQESSAGPTSSTVTVSAKTINWSSVSVSSDPQVDTRRLWIRNTTTQSNFYLAGTISNNSATTASTSISDTALTTIGPDEDENNPPSAGVKYIAFHRGRLFVADDVNVYYSKLAPLIESFDPDAYEPVSPEDGRKITGIISVFDILVIFKSDATYALVGDNPDTWTLRPIDATKGCTSHRSIIQGHNSARLFWWSEHGPTMWDGGANGVELIGRPFILDTLDTLSLDPDYTSKVCGAPDPARDRIVWAVPQLSQIRNTLIIPFNERLDRFESDGWDPIDVSAMASIDDDAGQPFVMLGSYAGQVFKFWTVDNDGIAVATTASGTFVAAGTSATTITDLTATFDTTGGKLTERKVTVLDADGERVGTGLRQYITSNTGTALTLNTAVLGLVIGATYTYHIGGPAFDWYSAWLTQGDAFLKKRYLFVYLQLRLANMINGLKLNFYQSYNLNPSVSSVQDIDVDIESGLWDQSLWDVALWDGSQDVAQRWRVGRTGTALLVRVRHYAPNADLVLAKLGVIHEPLSEKLG